MKVRVVGPYQVNHDGKNRVKGDEFDAPKGDAEQWISRGYVEEVKEPAKSSARKTEPKDEAKAESRSSKKDDDGK